MAKEAEISKSDTAVSKATKSTVAKESHKQHIESINKFQLVTANRKQLNKTIQLVEKHRNQGLVERNSK